MAGYTAPPTWGAGPWTFSDANIYVRDNFNSVRNYQTAVRRFSDSASFNTSPVTVAAHSALCTAAPNEQSSLSVIIAPRAATSHTGSPLIVVVEVFDQSAASIGSGYFLNIAPTDNWAGCVIAGATIGAGTNPGITIKMYVDSGSLSNFEFHTYATVAPLG